jgi:hypothetical protein
MHGRGAGAHQVRTAARARTAFHQRLKTPAVVARRRGDLEGQCATGVVEDEVDLVSSVAPVEQP